MKTLLVIDKPSQNRQLYIEQLQKEGYTVTVTPTNEIAATFLLKNSTFDGIICPEAILSQPNNTLLPLLQSTLPNTRIILLKKNSDATLNETLQLPLSGLITQPVDPARLITLLQFIDTPEQRVQLSDIDFPQYLTSLSSQSGSKAISIQGEQGKGYLIFHQGKLHYASYGDLRGELAFQALIALAKGSCQEKKLKQMPPVNIHTSFEQLMEQSQKQQQHQAEDAIPVLSSDFLMDEEKVPSNTATLAGKQATPWYQHTLFYVSLVLCICAALGGYIFFYHQKDSKITNLSKTDPKLASHQQSDNSASNSHRLASATGKISTVSTANVNSALAVTSSASPAIILRLHGSNTIGSKLAPNLAYTYMEQVLHAKDIRIEQKKAAVEKIVTGQTNEGLVGIEIFAHGSSTGFKDLLAGSCDVGMASRRIKDKEKAALKEHGEMTSPSSEHILALDGIAVIVNKHNNLKNINISQVGDIFSGKITDWAQIPESGLKGAINVYSRDDKSGTYDTFKSIVLKKTPLTDGAKRFESNPELSDKVSMDMMGIGFTGLPYIRQSKAIAISSQGTAPVLPSFFTVATEDYPLARRLYLYLPGDSNNPVAARFIDFCLARDGQKVVNSTGFVDLQIRAFTAAIDTAQNQVQNHEIFNRYLQEIEGKKRLSLNFRFNEGSKNLDNRSLRDLDRMVDFLKEYTFDTLTLIGFTDNMGSYANNTRLALERAKAIENELKIRGIPVRSILSASEELPIASNTSIEGRDKNRRVEIWVGGHNG
ncbi:substrate-binding domain-containing protein [Desulfogranum japonicum]|uniref:substrate-binding domain-containing protein n=1 Tax=Desulfogranum japonicum TaxID=231447 RepID=UPI0013767480|nr:substrate-binding domain-containing protein [Desulfogranum japonicum]